MNNLNEVRKAAGLELIEEDNHEKDEQALFETAYDNMMKVKEMTANRLKDKGLSDEHAKQYTALQSCATKCCDEMDSHLKSYK